MVRGFYAQVVDALKAAGYTFKRQGKGDHEIWHNATAGKSVTVDRGRIVTPHGQWRHEAGRYRQAVLGLSQAARISPTSNPRTFRTTCRANFSSTARCPASGSAKRSNRLATSVWLASMLPSSIFSA